MTFNDIILAINGIVTIVIAILTYMNRNAIQQVHLLINSRLTELLKNSNAASMAEGREIGRAENKS